MLGAIIGDIVGSVYEFRTLKHKDFPFWSDSCTFTDDTVMTIAVANVCRRLYDNTPVCDEAHWQYAFQQEMHRLGNAYPHQGYGKRFLQWLSSPDPQPYNSLGNGSAMRVSPVGLASDSLEECLRMARLSAAPSHNHPEGIRGAQAIAAAVWLAKNGAGKERIFDHIHSAYYDLSFTLDEIRPFYAFDATCPNSVPQAIVAFLESDGFEDAIRNAVSIGGDSDTIAAMAGSIAEAYYGIPQCLADTAMTFLPPVLQADVIRFYQYIHKKTG